MRLGRWLGHCSRILAGRPDWFQRWRASSALALFTLSAPWAHPEGPDALQQQFRGYARDQVHDLSGGQALACFGPMIGSARLVALGEPVSGAHEPLAERNRMVEYAVSRLGFTAVALESALSSSKCLYDYVLGTTAASDAQLAAAFSHGFGSWQENLDLVHFLRRYNLGHPGAHPVRLYGVDLTREFSTCPIGALAGIAAYLDGVDADLAADFRTKSAGLDGRLSLPEFTSLAQVEKDRIAARLDDLANLLRGSEPELIRRSSQDEYDWALRRAINAAQDCSFLRRVPGAEGSPAGAGSLRETENMREVAMADNLEWVLQREQPSGRVLFYSHAAHTQAAPQHFDPADARGRLLAGQQTVGAYLRARLGREVFLIGATFGQTRGFPSPSPPGPSGDTLPYLLGSLGYTLCVLQLRGIPHSGLLADWMNAEEQVRLSLTAPARWLRPGRDLDAVMYFAELTPALPAILHAP